MDFLNTTTAQYWIDRNLRIDGDFSFTTRNNYSRSFKSPLSYTFRNETDLTKKGSMTENLGRGLSFLGKLMVSYNRTFFEKLYVTSMAGSSLESTTADNSSYTSLGFYSDVLGHPNFALGYGGSARSLGLVSRSLRLLVSSSTGTPSTTTAIRWTSSTATKLLEVR